MAGNARGVPVVIRFGVVAGADAPDAAEAAEADFTARSFELTAATYAGLSDTSTFKMRVACLNASFSSLDLVWSPPKILSTDIAGVSCLISAANDVWSGSWAMAESVR